MDEGNYQWVKQTSTTFDTVFIALLFLSSLANKKQYMYIDGDPIVWYDKRTRNLIIVFGIMPVADIFIVIPRTLSTVNSHFIAYGIKEYFSVTFPSFDIDTSIKCANRTLSISTAIMKLCGDIVLFIRLFDNSFVVDSKSSLKVTSSADETLFCSFHASAAFRIMLPIVAYKYDPTQAFSIRI
uniref:Uncharacterized protein n=1 Tax=Glossina brevipalpis TaxID=37001 RepID=A0A1A9WW20_9MUSC